MDKKTQPVYGIQCNPTLELKIKSIKNFKVSIYFKELDKNKKKTGHGTPYLQFQQLGRLRQEAVSLKDRGLHGKSPS